MPLLLPSLACLGIATVAAYTDHKRGLIPNLITVPAALLGLLLNGLGGGWEGLIVGLQGLALGFGLLLIPCLLGGTGGGDLKLLAAFGAFLGPALVFQVFLYGSVAGGVVALFLLVRHYPAVALSLLQPGGLAALIFPRERLSLGAFPFATCLWVGLTLSLALKGMVNL